MNDSAFLANEHLSKLTQDTLFLVGFAKPESDKAGCRLRAVCQIVSMVPRHEGSVVGNGVPVVFRLVDQMLDCSVGISQRGGYRCVCSIQQWDRRYEITPRAKRAEGFSKHGVDVEHVLQHVLRDHQVERFVWECQAFQILAANAIHGGAERDSGEELRRNVAPSTMFELWRHASGRRRRFMDGHLSPIGTKFVDCGHECPLTRLAPRARRAAAHQSVAQICIPDNKHCFLLANGAIPSPLVPDGKHFPKPALPNAKAKKVYFFRTMRSIHACRLSAVKRSVNCCSFLPFRIARTVG